MKPTIQSKAVAACVKYVQISAEIKRLGREIGDAIGDCPDIEAPHLGAFYKHSGDFSELVARDYEAEMMQCPACSKAHALVLERKKMRYSLGAAKKQISIIGKAATK